MKNKIIGTIKGVIERNDGSKEIIEFKNTVLKKGRSSMAKSLIGEKTNLLISSMVFGDGGFDQEKNSVRVVNSNRDSLFGIARVNKPVAGQIDPVNDSQVIFTAVLSKQDGNGFTLNEMALQKEDGELYSLSTFPNLSKTEDIQIVWTWILEFAD